MESREFVSDEAYQILLSLFLFVTVILGALVLSPQSASAKVTGECYYCHTMHNSQGGSTMNGQATPYYELLRSNCMGCHGMGGSQKIATFAGQDTPQVYHTDSSGDLAGGNFAYITGDKGSGASMSKGHDIIEINYPETILTNAPGRQHDMSDLLPNFTCAGPHGCHGVRGAGGMQGAHHRDSCGKCDVALITPGSYRFLRGVKGLENNGSNRWQNVAPGDHNEYFGATTPMAGGGACVECHEAHAGPDGSFGIRPLNQTISGFCATCHINFHSVTGIGGDVLAPFTRHPTDVILPVGGEYAGYTVYNTTAPVARTTVPDTVSSTVLPGTDVVMCLSCHSSHASDYDDMLRWDYSTIIADGGSNNNGCFVCHTKKDDGN